MSAVNAQHILELRASNATKASEDAKAIIDLGDFKKDSTSTQPIDLLKLMISNYKSIAKFYEDEKNVTMMAKMGKELKVRLYAAATTANATKVKLAEGIEIRMQFPDSRDNYSDELTWNRFCAISALYLSWLGTINASVNKNLPTALGTSLKVAESADETMAERFWTFGWFALPGAGYLPHTIVRLGKNYNKYKSHASAAMIKFYGENYTAGYAFLYCLGLSFVSYQKENGKTHNDASEYADFIKANPSHPSGGLIVAAFRQEPTLSKTFHSESKEVIQQFRQSMIYLESKEAFKRVTDGLGELFD